jgi:hypothetical protein
MKTLKTPKGIHNRIHHGKWYNYGDKTERKERRKLFKGIRHKLLMRIPLTEEEEKFRNLHYIDENTKMAYTGYPLPKYDAHGKYYRF